MGTSFYPRWIRGRGMYLRCLDLVGSARLVAEKRNLIGIDPVCLSESGRQVSHPDSFPGIDDVSC
jgi:hypothetical protein